MYLRKKLARMVLVIIMLIFSFTFFQTEAFADGENSNQPAIQQSEQQSEPQSEQQDNTELTTEQPATEEENSPLDVKLTLTVRMYRGDKIDLGLSALEDADKVEVYNSNSRLAVITKKGIIKAKRCGNAKSRLTIYSGNKIKILEINVKITKCSYRKRKTLQMYIGEEAAVKASTEVEGAVISLTDSKKAVAKIKNDKLIAKKKGKTVITACAEKDGKKSKLSITVNVLKKPEMKVTNSMKDKWFIGSVMAGHSVGVGFEDYCSAQYNGFLGNARHISVGCYGVYNDMAPVSGSSLHPTINGRKARLKDHITALGTKKVFINYGLNDIGVYGPYKFISSYESLINELIRQNKKTTVYIVSPTPMYKSSGDLSNYNMRIINKALKKYAKKTKRVEFIDVFTPMLDSSGKLADEYCSDDYCHITYAGYKVYADTLKDFAKKKIIEETDAKDKAATEREIKKEKKISSGR